MNNKNEVYEISEATAMSTLGRGFKNAEKILNEPDKIEELFQKVENKLKVIPVVGEKRDRRKFCVIDKL